MTLEILTADALAPLRHGFFTRRGGASSGVFEGLNCGRGSTDQSDIVQINRDRAAAAMGVEPEALISVHQTHSAIAEVITGPSADGIKADALVTRIPGLALGILTADCQPILLADPDNGVIAAVHAGWRGARDGIIEATLETMRSLGAEDSRIHAVIGPSISQANYEVGPDFMESFLDDDPENHRFFVPGAGDRVHFDLPSYGLHRLRGAGIAHAEWIRHCTYEDPRRFYSYRRSVHQREADYGRLISIIRL